MRFGNLRPSISTVWSKGVMSSLTPMSSERSAMRARNWSRVWKWKASCALMALYDPSGYQVEGRRNPRLRADRSSGGYRKEDLDRRPIRPGVLVALLGRIPRCEEHVERFPGRL